MRLGRGSPGGKLHGLWFRGMSGQCGSSEESERHQMRGWRGSSSQLPTWQAVLRDFISTLKIERWYDQICVVKRSFSCWGWAEWP